MEKVKKCNKTKFKHIYRTHFIYTTPWDKLGRKCRKNGCWRDIKTNCSQQTSEVGRCYVVIPITGQLCLRLGRAVAVVLAVIVMLVIKVVMFMTCLIFCSESSMIISCFISLFSCQYESKILKWILKFKFNDRKAVIQ